ncbi:MAG TPA: S8 family serine peptidase [Gemmatimonadaceae bacterium]|jgi:subtilisin family serine protease|nr:S8 family serine peptidase [Gemmatimonadaceae bacterium]
MNRRYYGAAAILLSASVAACSNDVVSPSSDAVVRTARAVTPSANGEYLVLLTGNGSKTFSAKVEALGGKVQFVHEGAGLAGVSGLSAAAAKQLVSANGVQDVQPNIEFTLAAPVAAVEADASDISIASQANPTTAARYVWQWNMRAIGANTAWAAGKLGSSNVTVAIIDSGIDYDIPDMNGLVDLSRSTSFVPSDSAITATYFPTRHLSDDYNGHGTNVATQVSSKAAALAGVTSRTTLISVKAIGRTGSGNTTQSLRGVLWAADHGAQVANMSLGGAFAKNEIQQLVPFINRVMSYAHSKGMLIVVAAGNELTDLDHNGNVYQTYCNATHVICVSAFGPAVATGSVNAFAYYSNYGRSAVDVAAPGGNADAANNLTVSAWPWGNDIASWVWSYCPKFRIASLTAAGVPVLTACSAGNRLTGSIGTSQAAPHVAGLAALILAENPGMSIDDVKDLILSSTDDVGAPGTDPFYGKGKINVAKALGL